jgi:hypothetical protein
VGVFVFLGMLAIVAAVLVLGGRSLLAEPVIFESYFDESVEGLAVGSPVKLRGVEIGRVAQIGFVQDYYHFASDEERVTAGNKVLVRMEVVPRRGGGEVGEELERLVAQGLRLQLSRSAITGTSFLQADFSPRQARPCGSPGSRGPLHPLRAEHLAAFLRGGRMPSDRGSPRRGDEEPDELRSPLDAVESSTAGPKEQGSAARGPAPDGRQLRGAWAADPRLVRACGPRSASVALDKVNP